MKKLLFATIFSLFLTSCGGDSLKEFAQCINDSGAKFYGTFTCTECKKQKEFFAPYEDDLPYIECDENAENSQTDQCKEEGIKATPTWIFADGSYALGKQSFKELAERTACIEPETN